MHKIQHKDWKTRNCDYLLKNRKNCKKRLWNKWPQT